MTTTTTTPATTTETTLTVTAAGYTATLDRTTGTVRIDGPEAWAGDGRWDGASIVDCAANLGDDAWDALDAALTAAGA